MTNFAVGGLLDAVISDLVLGWWDDEFGGPFVIVVFLGIGIWSATPVDTGAVTWSANPLVAGTGDNWSALILDEAVSVVLPFRLTLIDVGGDVGGDVRIDLMERRILFCVMQQVIKQI
jgi:hypothetical protein